MDPGPLPFTLTSFLSRSIRGAAGTQGQWIRGLYPLPSPLSFPGPLGALLGLGGDGSGAPLVESWALRDAVFLEDVKNVPIGKVIKVRYTKSEIEFALSASSSSSSSSPSSLRWTVRRQPFALFSSFIIFLIIFLLLRGRCRGSRLHYLHLLHRFLLPLDPTFLTLRHIGSRFHSPSSLFSYSSSSSSSSS